MSWKPSRVEQVFNAPSTSTRPIKVETDLGVAFLKTPSAHNKEGPQAVAREWIGTMAARLIGLPTFDVAILAPSQAEVGLIRQAGHPEFGQGECLAIRYENGHTWDGATKSLRRVVNKSQLAELIVLDTWIRNRDRFSPTGGAKGAPRRNHDNVWFSNTEHGLQLLAIDHTHCLCPGDISARAPSKQDAQDPTTYGYFPEFQPLVDSAQLVEVARRLPEVAARLTAELDAIRLPRSWEVDSAGLSAIKTFLLGRADYLTRCPPRAVSSPQLPLL